MNKGNSFSDLVRCYKGVAAVCVVYSISIIFGISAIRYVLMQNDYGPWETIIVIFFIIAWMIIATYVLIRNRKGLSL